MTINYIDTVDICWKYGELTIEIVLKRGLYLFMLKKDILSLSWKKVQYLAPLILLFLCMAIFSNVRQLLVQVYRD